MVGTMGSLTLQLDLILHWLFEPGIYFVFVKDEVVYVGRTNCLGRRVIAHHERARRGLEPHFDDVKVLACKTEDLSALEKHFIDKLKPKYNRAPAVLLPASGLEQFSKSNAVLSLVSKIKASSRKHCREDVLDEGFVDYDEDDIILEHQL